MDGQQQSHGDSYAYSTAEWPEFYDLWVERLFGPGPGEDAGLFQNSLENLIAATPSEEKITILDLGTGTGRVIRDLIDAVALRDDNFRFHFIGVDHSRSMLDRALARSSEQQKMYSKIAEPIWLLGSAAEFCDQTLQGAQDIDMLIFAAGGISHLTADGEMKSFLRQVKMALRDNSRSVAIISVLHEFIETLKSTKETPTGLEADDELEDVKILSRDYKGIAYIKSPTMTVRDGSSRTDRFSVKAIEDSAEYEGLHGIVTPKIIWKKEMEWSVKYFNEGHWKEEIDRAGLQIISAKDGSIQRWYFLQHAAV